LTGITGEELQVGKGKKVSKSVQIGATGTALIGLRVSAMGHVWHERHIDAGIDGMIELRDPATGEVSNCHLLVQSKAQDALFAGETHERFHYICDDRDLDYWMKATEPVLLICSHPKDERAWWVHVQSYFADPARRADRRIDFNKATMALAGDITDRLFAIADPHGRTHTPGPDRRTETLVSNLLPADLPPAIWSYETKLHGRRAVYEAQESSGLPVRDDFVLWGGRILAWEQADTSGLSAAVTGSPTVRPIGELREFEEDGDRAVVQLLNNALRQDLKPDCDFHGKRHFLYFRASEDLSDRKWNTSGSNWRTVFKGYPKKSDPSTISYYRHSALSWQFIQIDGDWFCELVPDYFFTRDGHRESRYAADQLRGIKKIERNAAVLQETRLWASILRGREDLFDQTERILDFGALVTFKVDQGIDDAAWKQAEEGPDEDGDLGDTLFEVAE
jgi:hypothetical protein